MQSRRDFNMLLKNSMQAFLPTLITVSMIDQSSESQYLLNFMKPVDPQECTIDQ